MLITFKGANIPISINPAFITVVRQYQSLVMGESYTLIYVSNKQDPELIEEPYDNVIKRLQESGIHVG